MAIDSRQSFQTCTPPSLAKPLNASGDIVGYGILAAFLGTATITIVAVLLAYFFEAIDDDLLNDMDGKVIASVGWSGRSAARQADISPADREKHARLRAKRIRSFTQFILALSDQQLVTGLAILIAAVSGKNKLSKFEFSVAHSLAWFSSTTHLATLDVLRPALRSQNPWMLHTRVFGMLCVLALLVYTSVELALMGTPSSAFISCAEDKQIPQNLLATIPTMLLIVSGYIIRLQDLYFYGRGLGPLLSFLRALRLKEHKSLTYGDLYARSLANTRCDLLMRYNLISGRRAGRVSVAYFWGYLQYGTAFLSTLPTIAFSFLYGIGQLVIRCWVKAPKLTPESREMGFGQIMALFLLILPILAAGEVFTGKKNDGSKMDNSQQESPGKGDHDKRTSSDVLPSHDTGHEYDMNFEVIKKYLFTTAKQPDEILEHRRDFLLERYKVLRTTEHRVGFGFAFGFLSVDLLFGVLAAILLLPLELSEVAGIMVFSFWIGWRVVFQGIELISKTTKAWGCNDAEKIYKETEELITLYKS